MSPPLRITSHSPEETQEIGRFLGQQAKAGDVFLLTGELGAGKTCFTQGITWGLGIESYARSPTFVIIAQYQGRLSLHHIDLFRIQEAEEAWDLGLEEYLAGEGVCVVEWADRFPEIFPPESTWVALEYGDEENDRLITIKANRKGYGRFLAGVKQAVEARSDS